MERRTVVVERSPVAEALDDFCLMLLAILFPPAAVLIRTGCGGSFCLNLLLTLLGWLPGVIHAFFVIAAHPPEPVYVAEIPSGPPIVVVEQAMPSQRPLQGTVYYATNAESQPFYSPGYTKASSSASYPHPQHQQHQHQQHQQQSQQSQQQQPQMTFPIFTQPPPQQQQQLQQLQQLQQQAIFQRMQQLQQQQQQQQQQVRGVSGMGVPTGGYGFQFAPTDQLAAPSFPTQMWSPSSGSANDQIDDDDLSDPTDV
eukprot:Opistho-2@466